VKPRLSLCTIMKDEELNVDACLGSVEKFVDEIVVVDTGSTDRTVELAQRHGARVFTFDHRTNPESFFVDDEATCASFGAPAPFSGEIALGDFAAARNESFRRATGDFILWIDGDDVVVGAEHLPGMVAEMAERRLDMAFLAYGYAHDHAGREIYRQWRERLVRRDCARWVNAVHEVMIPNRPVAQARYDAVKIKHCRRPDRKSIPNRNYKLLLRSVAKESTQPGWDPSKIDPRTLFYLGQEARFVDAPRAAAFYADYLKRSGWNEERAAAHGALGMLYEGGVGGGDPDTSLQRAMREWAVAAAEMPDNPDGFYGLARVAYMQQRWNDCVRYSEYALKIGNPDSMLGANPLERTYRPHIYLNHSLWHLGRIEEAIASCKMGLQACPDDPGVPGGSKGMLVHNLAFYEAELKRRAEEAARANAAPAPDRPLPGEILNFDKNEDVSSAPVIGIPRDAMVIWAMQLWKQLAHVAGDGARAATFLDALPADVALDPAISRMREETQRRFPDAKSAFARAREVATMAYEGAHVVREALARMISAQGKGAQLTPIPEEPGGSTSIAFSENYQVTYDTKPRPAIGKVVFYLGPCFEAWSPRSPNLRGIGGSETACIEVARHLASMGADVHVFAETEKPEEVFDGVTYHHHSRFRGGIDCDVFIASRTPWSVDQYGPVRAALKLLWVHDIHCGPPSPQMERWLYQFDRVLCLSEWHKGFFLSCYPSLDPAAVLVTRNGIDPARFAMTTAKQNHLVFSSSPNRGLDMLLHNFRFIRSQVPDAELHIYYGFDCWETMARQNNLANELAVIQRYKDLIAQAERAGGVKWHGRVDQMELARAFLRAKVWPYLTEFTETSCISAMEAQAAGCVPVASRLAALGETVKHGVLFDNGDPQTATKWVDEVVYMLKDEEHRRPIAEAGRAYALANLTWRGVAESWVELFGKLRRELRANPIHAYKAVQ
jgi:glycosyltransferase involved in cell wall biosynthesis